MLVRSLRRASVRVPPLARRSSTQPAFVVEGRRKLTASELIAYEDALEREWLEKIKASRDEEYGPPKPRVLDDAPPALDVNVVDNEKIQKEAAMVGDTIRIMFAEEEEALSRRIPHPMTTYEANAIIVRLLSHRRVNVEKLREGFNDTEALEQMFYCFMANREGDRAMIAYFDYKRIATPPLLMTEYMALYSSSKPDHDLLVSVYGDLTRIEGFQWSTILLTTLMKGFAATADSFHFWQCYERLYEIGVAPSRIHWECGLIAAARSADFFYFSRFYHRLVSKNVKPSREAMRLVFREWGEIALKKRQKKRRVLDVLHCVEIALKNRNYKHAIHFIKNMYKLDLHPVPLVYEMFIIRAMRDYPSMKFMGRKVLRRMSTVYKFVNTSMVSGFNAFVSVLQKRMGPEVDLENVPKGPRLVQPKKRLTRRQARKLNGYTRTRKVWRGPYADDSRLFEFVPHYERRLKRDAKLKEKAEKKQELELEIDDEIAAAKAKYGKWKVSGFEGDFKLNAKSEAATHKYTAPESGFSVREIPKPQLNHPQADKQDL